MIAAVTRCTPLRTVEGTNLPKKADPPLRPHGESDSLLQRMQIPRMCGFLWHGEYSANVDENSPFLQCLIKTARPQAWYQALLESLQKSARTFLRAQNLFTPSIVQEYVPFFRTPVSVHNSHRRVPGKPRSIQHRCKQKLTGLALTHNAGNLRDQRAGSPRKSDRVNMIDSTCENKNE